MEISSIVKKALKNPIPIRIQRRLKIRMVAKIDAYTKWSEAKAIKIEISILEKIISNIIVASKSDLNIISFQTIKKLGLSVTSLSPFVIKIENRSSSILKYQIKNYKT